MVKIYDFSKKTPNFAVCGGCNGKFKELFTKITFKRGEVETPSVSLSAYDDLCDDIPPIPTYDDTLIVVTGNNRFGYKPLSYYLELFESYNETLHAMNIHVLFVRGTDDDPSYFSENKIDLSNIKTISDYSIVKTKAENILCLGGGISYNRSWKRDLMSVCPNPSSILWENESPIVDEDKFREIVKLGIKITSVVSYMPPVPSKSPSPSALLYWSKTDKTLKSDWNKTNAIMVAINDILQQNKMKPKWWACGESRECFRIDHWTIPFFNMVWGRDGILDPSESIEHETSPLLSSSFRFSSMLDNAIIARRG